MIDIFGLFSNLKERVSQSQNLKQLLINEKVLMKEIENSKKFEIYVKKVEKNE